MSGKKNILPNYISIETLKVSTHWEEGRLEVAPKVGRSMMYSGSQVRVTFSP